MENIEMNNLPQIIGLVFFAGVAFGVLAGRIK